MSDLSNACFMLPAVGDFCPVLARPLPRPVSCLKQSHRCSASCAAALHLCDEQADPEIVSTAVLVLSQRVPKSSRPSSTRQTAMIPSQSLAAERVDTCRMLSQHRDQIPVVRQAMCFIEGFTRSATFAHCFAHHGSTIATLASGSHRSAPRRRITRSRQTPCGQDASSARMSWYGVTIARQAFKKSCAFRN